MLIFPDECCFLSFTLWSHQVGQSLISSLPSTLLAALACIPPLVRAPPQVWNRKRGILSNFYVSQLLLCNGPGTCLPLIVLARILSTISPCTIVYVESVCRVTSLSLTARWPNQNYLKWKKITKKLHLQAGLALCQQDLGAMAGTGWGSSEHYLHRKIFVNILPICDTIETIYEAEPSAANFFLRNPE